jgi:hypothetical protein
VVEAGIARLMLDPEPDELDAQDIIDIRAALDRVDRGEIIDAKIVHARLRSKYQGNQ